MLLGEYTPAYGSRGRVRIPRKLFEAMARDLVGAVPVMVWPEKNEGLGLVSLAAEDADLWLSNALVQWRYPFLADLRAGGRGEPTTPRWSIDTPSAKVEAASAALRTELSAAPRTPAGKALESLIGDILESHGIWVQHNVRLLGADADLIAATVDEQNRAKCVLLECKDNRKSGRPVGIHEVMRLYGYREALHLASSVPDGLLVTTTGVSPAGRRFAKATKIEVLAPEEVLQWAERNSPRVKADPPLFKISVIAADGRLTLPPDLLTLMGVDPNEPLAVTGVFDHIRLQGHAAWELRKRRAEEAMTRVQAME